MIARSSVWLAAALTLVIGATLVLVRTGDSDPAPGQLVVLSTSDVMGELNPCGCQIPKGGMSRRASYRDSLADAYGQVTLVDNGGFFPETDGKRDVAWFMIDAMKSIGTDAVGIGPRELRFGWSFLKTHLDRTRLPATSANLIEVATGKPALEPWLIRTIGSVQVGYFSLMSETTDRGPSRDSLRVDNPTATAPRVVGELRRNGATVVVLLSQLGKAEGEDLVSAVPGIDVVICGPNAPLYPKGRKIKNTYTSYGGDRGHYVGRTILTLDKAGRVTKGENQTVALDPSVGERTDILKMVKTFESHHIAPPEDGHNH
jgi:2',3'-cyclic-nucleotide 2'-phosphodiesterase (5'-nucleotidase family)